MIVVAISKNWLNSIPPPMRMLGENLLLSAASIMNPRSSVPPVSSRHVLRANVNKLSLNLCQSSLASPFRSGEIVLTE